jgi:hypothetical protein
MDSIDFTQVELQHLITHHIGNKLRDEKFRLSSEPTIIAQDSIEFLLKYFLSSIRQDEFFTFFHSINLDLNEIFTLSKEIFSKPKSFIATSQGIAKLLYEHSTHPKINEGELTIASFSNIKLNNKFVDAIGLFKSETMVPFLKIKNQKSQFSVNHEFGFEIKGVDKGCLIFNINQKTGFQISIINNGNNSSDAQYWKDNFLKVKQLSNEFHQTNQFLGITKDFVTNQLSEEFEVSKADKIDLLNRSVKYFKTHAIFEKKEFEKEVFQDKGIIKSFQNFDSTFREENDINLQEDFSISVEAVKKQARVFKSVLKLDKNFHIYIHGDRELIEQGVERDGRKYYKIYYKDEN